jgi:hypothetical protein
MPYNGELRRTTDIDLGVRVATVETQVGNLSENIRALAVDVRSLADTVSMQGKEFDRHLEKIMVLITQASAPKQTNWLGLISVSSAVIIMLLAVGAAVFAPLSYRIGINETTLMKLNDVVQDHVRNDVSVSELSRLHTISQMRADQNEKAIATLDAKLQKEYGLVTDTLREETKNVKNQVGELDSRLQSEFRTANDTIKETDVALEKSWTERHNDLRREFEIARDQGTPITREHLAELTAQFKSIERRVEIIEDKRP